MLKKTDGLDGALVSEQVWNMFALDPTTSLTNPGHHSPTAASTEYTLTTAWQRFRITGTRAGGQTGLWIVVRQFAGNSDNWTAGAIYLRGACLQQGNDPRSGYARTWASQTAIVAAEVTCGAVVIAAKDTTELPLRIYGAGSNLADHRLLQVTAGGALVMLRAPRFAALWAEGRVIPPQVAVRA